MTRPRIRSLLLLIVLVVAGPQTGAAIENPGQPADSAPEAPTPTAVAACPPERGTPDSFDGAWYPFDLPHWWPPRPVVYDAVRDRIVGLNEAGLWALSHQTGSEWERIITLGAIPGGLEQRPATYDPAEDRMLFLPTGANSQDLWEVRFGALNEVRKLPVAPSLPEGVSGYTAVLDTKRNRVVVFGGREGGFCCVQVCHPWGCICEQFCSFYTGNVHVLPLESESGWQSLPAVTSDWLTLAREGAKAIYDPKRDRMLLFGGVGLYPLAGKQVYELTFEGTPTWRVLQPSGTAPPEFSTPQYDPHGDQVLFVSNEGQSVVTWALQLAGSPTWVRLPVVGELPRARGGPSLVLDHESRTFWSLGGLVGGMDLDAGPKDVWALSLEPSPAWRPGPPRPQRPSSLYRHSVAWDAKRNRGVMTGGEGYAQGMYRGRSTAWESGPNGWTSIGAATPMPVAGVADHASIYDAASDRIVVIGGMISLTPDAPVTRLTNAVWELNRSDASGWRTLSPGGNAPAPRSGHSAIYDAGHERAIVFGGRSAEGDLRDCWALSLAGDGQWTELQPLGPGPAARTLHRAVYDPSGPRMIVFGGLQSGTSSTLDDLWALELEGEPRWVELKPSGPRPPPRHRFSASLDEADSRLLVIGGSMAPLAGACLLDDVWSLSLRGQPAWTRLDPVGELPRTLQGHDAFLDPLANRVMAVGGAFGTSNTTWVLDLEGPFHTIGAEARPASPSEPVNPRANGVLPIALLSNADLHAEAIDLDRMTCFGAEVARNGHGDRSWESRDVNRDGLRDVVAHFDLATMDLRPTDRSLQLRGFTMTGVPVKGSAAITTVPSRATASMEWSGQARGAEPAELSVESSNLVLGSLVALVNLPDTRGARLQLFDLAGRRLIERTLSEQPSGSHRVRVAGRGDLDAGIYWLRLVFPGGSHTQKVVVLD